MLNNIWLIVTTGILWLNDPEVKKCIANSKWYGSPTTYLHEYFNNNWYQNIFIDVTEKIFYSRQNTLKTIKIYFLHCVAKQQVKKILHNHKYTITFNNKESSQKYLDILSNLGTKVTLVKWYLRLKISLFKNF